MEFQVLTLAMSLVALIFGVLSTLALINLTIKVAAMEKATHTVQLVPVDEEVDRANEEYLKKHSKKDSPWATSEEAIAKENKLYREEVEDEMAEFALTDEDKEILSL